MTSSHASRRLVVTIFCGGRGGSHLIRELLRHPEIELYAVINAYDDGLSTGELRDFIPGMLGPSDFRKNLANFLHWHSPRQYALTRLLDYRVADVAGGSEIDGLRRWAGQDDFSDVSMLGPRMRSAVEELGDTRNAVGRYLRAFFAYQQASPAAFRFENCSLGNLIFAGAYLAHQRNFNAATSELSRVFESQAKLLNVTNGENRILVALKEDGEILDTEAKVVGPQSNRKVLDIFLLEKPLTPGDWARLQASPGVTEKRTILEELHRPPALSPEAREALLESDIIIYGPGTQFSSLLPSYKTAEMGETIRQSRARSKIFVTNIHGDHDIQALTAAELVRQALVLLDDPDNENQTITHVLETRTSRRPDLLFPTGDRGDLNSILKWEVGDFENPARPGAHSGYLTVREMINLHEETITDAEPELDIYVNLYRRSLAVGQLVEEFLELPWQRQFKRVRLRLNKVDVPQVTLPAHLSIESVRRDETFSEVHELSDWADKRSSKYLVTLSGDGEYRLSDILYGMEIVTQHPFAAVYGSRTQSRAQFYHSLSSAYGESWPLYLLSLAGGFLFSLLFVLRFGVIFSDPLTGFRLYNRSALAGLLPKLARLDDHSASGITKLLMHEGREIAEIPVSYRTFKGFTNTRWRLWRSFRNAWRIFF